MRKKPPIKNSINTDAIFEALLSPVLKADGSGICSKFTISPSAHAIMSGFVTIPFMISLGGTFLLRKSSMERTASVLLMGTTMLMMTAVLLVAALP